LTKQFFKTKLHISEAKKKEITGMDSSSLLFFSWLVKKNGGG
jgi:hypothetical protein